MRQVDPCWLAKLDTSMLRRRFLIAPSLARLIRKEQGVAGQVIEEDPTAHPHRDQFVSLEPNHCELVLTTTREGADAEERTGCHAPKPKRFSPSARAR